MSAYSDYGELLNDPAESIGEALSRQVVSDREEMPEILVTLSHIEFFLEKRWEITKHKIDIIGPGKVDIFLDEVPEDFDIETFKKDLFYRQFYIRILFVRGVAQFG